MQFLNNNKNDKLTFTVSRKERKRKERKSIYIAPFILRIVSKQTWIAVLPAN